MKATQKPRCFVRLFKPEFEDKIRNGSKTSTIRPIPRILPKAGDIQSNRVWEGRPYNSSQRIINEVVLRRVWNVIIAPREIVIRVPPAEADEFEREVRGSAGGSVTAHISKTEGFDGWDSMLKWFNNAYTLQREFVMYVWWPPAKPIPPLQNVTSWRDEGITIYAR